jgi:signal transduction histidine kinase
MSGKNFAKPTVVLVLILIASIFIWHFYNVDLHHNKITSNNNLFNLTKERVTWDVFYGKSPTCDAVPCHVTPSYPSEKFTKTMVLPAREFPLTDYQRGDFIYARAKLRLPNKVKKGLPIVLNSIYIWAENYKVYINGKFWTNGSKGTFTVPLPDNLLKDEFVVGLEIDPGNLLHQGLANLSDLVVGPANEILSSPDPASVMLTADLAWVFLPLLVSIVFFSMFFLIAKQSTDIFILIIFGFIQSLNYFASSEYAERLLPDFALSPLGRTSINLMTDILFLIFVLNHFEVKKSWLLTKAALISSFLFIVIYWLFDHWRIAYALNTYKEIVFAIALLTGNILAYKRFNTSTFSSYSPARKHLAIATAMTFIITSIAGLVKIVEFVCQDYVGASCVPPYLASSAWFLLLFFGLSTITALKHKALDEELLSTEADVLLAKERLAVFAKSTKAVAHEMRRPLRLFEIALADLIHTPSSGITTDMRDRLTSSLYQARSTINNLLQFESPEKIRLDRDNVNLNHVLEGALKDSLIRIPRPDIVIVKDLDLDLELVADPERLFRVFSNIIDNALEMMPPNAELYIGTVICGTQYQIKFSNTGTFVPEEDRQKIFEPFYTKGKPNGTGLGLLIASGIVALHNGKIICSSSDHRTTFLITLPTGEKMIPPASITSHAKIKSIVIVDDDPFIVDAWVEAPKGSKVYKFTKPEEALSWLQNNQNIKTPMFFITDYVFENSQLTGVDIMQTLPKKPEWSVLYSDYDVTKEERSAFDLVVSKQPISVEEMFERIASERKV